MSATLDYAPTRLPRRPDVWLGRFACAMAIVSAAFILYLAYDTRCSMETWRGNWCGSAEARAESWLHLLGVMLIVPAAACGMAWHAKAGLAVCRTTLAAAAGGWVACLMV